MGIATSSKHKVLRVRYHHRLRHISLDIDDSTQRQQDIDNDGILLLRLECVARHTDGGIHPGDIDTVLQGDGQPVEWAEDRPGALKVLIKKTGAFVGFVEENLG